MAILVYSKIFVKPALFKGPQLAMLFFPNQWAIHTKF